MSAHWSLMLNYRKQSNAHTTEQPLVVHRSVHFHDSGVSHDKVVKGMEPMFVIEERIHTLCTFGTPVAEILEVHHGLNSCWPWTDVKTVLFQLERFFHEPVVD